jgi:hypothetical protein
MNMRATDFEVRNQTLLHFVVVGAALATYAFQRDDIVWALVKGHTDRRLLERIVFAIGTLLIFSSAALLTWVHAKAGSVGASSLVALDRLSFSRGWPYLGRILFALGIGLLTPIAGTAILLAGESVLVLRLLGLEYEREPLAIACQDAERLHNSKPLRWSDGLRRESAKWGLALTMVLFTLTLKDSLADILGATSVLLWATLNRPGFLRLPGKRRGA